MFPRILCLKCTVATACHLPLSIRYRSSVGRHIDSIHIGRCTYRLMLADIRLELDWMSADNRSIYRYIGRLSTDTRPILPISFSKSFTHLQEGAFLSEGTTQCKKTTKKTFWNTARVFQVYPIKLKIPTNSQWLLSTFFNLGNNML